MFSLYYKHQQRISYDHLFSYIPRCSYFSFREAMRNMHCCSSLIDVSVEDKMLNTIHNSEKMFLRNGSIILPTHSRGLFTQRIIDKKCPMLLYIIQRRVCCMRMCNTTSREQTTKKINIIYY